MHLQPPVLESFATASQRRFASASDQADPPQRASTAACEERVRRHETAVHPTSQGCFCCSFQDLPNSRLIFSQGRILLPGPQPTVSMRVLFGYRRVSRPGGSSSPFAREPASRSRSVEVTEKRPFVRRVIIERARYRWAVIRTVEGHTCAHGARSVNLILIFRSPNLAGVDYRPF
jgi:hypothetical protein